MKYYQYRTKQEFIQAIKHAEANKLFFSKDTMRFFGGQSFDIEIENDTPLFVITFSEKYHNPAQYNIDPNTLKLTTIRKVPNHV